MTSQTARPLLGGRWYLVSVHPDIRSCDLVQESLQWTNRGPKATVTVSLYYIRERLDLADTRQLNCTSFSEVPAEGVFFVWERVAAGRGSMTLEHCNAMLRVSREGPPAGGKRALKLSQEALELWPSGMGERFTTQNWFPGTTSKMVKRIMENWLVNYGTLYNDSNGYYDMIYLTTFNSI